MNLTALRDRCESRFGDTANRIVTEAEWLDYLNEAYMEVVGAEPMWPFLETRTTSLTISAGGQSVALPTDVTRVTAVFNATDKIPLAPIPGQAQFRHYFPDTSSQGMPLFYRLYAGNIDVYPTSQSAITLHVDHPAPSVPLALGADEPAFPEQYHNLLVYGALSLAYEDYPEIDPQGADRNRGRFTRLLENMRVELLQPRHEGYPGIMDLGA